MKTLRPDVLADLPASLRPVRERLDAKYLLDSGIVMSASPESLKRDSNTWAGLDTFSAKHLQPHNTIFTPDAAVCARVDLDHPIYFPDNLFTDCDDCGCRLQHRPDIPKEGDRLCVCCTARRLREQPN